jgi:hypothetical protein
LPKGAALRGGKARSNGKEDSPAELEKERAIAEAPTFREIKQNLPFVLEVFRIMHNIWLSCSMDAFWSHPLNMGLFNLFQRWAYAPSCRLWWPLLRPMYGSGFRRFMQEHLALEDSEHPEVQGRVTDPSDELPDGLARMHWLRSRPPQRPLPPKKKIYEYVIGLPVQIDGQQKVRYVEVQLGLAALQIRGTVARWRSDNFFVPPSLWGSGTGGKFLGELVKKLEAAGIEHLVVKLKQAAEKERSDFSTRQERNDLIAFYKGQRFSLAKNGSTMVRRLVQPKGSAPSA